MIHDKSPVSYTIHAGIIAQGFQLASGEAVGREHAPSPFSDSTLRLQAPHFRKRGFDLREAIPDLFWGTINIRLAQKLRLNRPDITLERVDWTAHEPLTRIEPETFSFARCCLAHNGRYHPGYLYYPHPETKPATNAHAYDAIEVLTHQVDELVYDEPIAVICRSDVFTSF